MAKYEIPEISYLFTAKELGRLDIYREAVLARFYNDRGDGTQSELTSRDIERLFYCPSPIVPTAPEVVNGDIKAPNHKPGDDTGC